MTTPATPGPYCFTYAADLPAFMFGPPTSPDERHKDLDDLAALEAKAWTDYYRLGRRNLAQLARFPLACLDEECRPTEAESAGEPAALVRVFLLVRRFHFEPGRHYRADARTFRRQGPPIAALWLHLTRDNLAGPGSFGSTQIVRLTIAPATEDAAPLVAACATFAAAVPAAFLPPSWPAPPGRRPVTVYLPTESQPTQLAPRFQALGFQQAGYEANAFGDNRPGRLYVLPNGLENLHAHPDQRHGDARP